LNGLPPDVARPAYDRAALRPGVVHLGPGAFHRAHQATVFDDLIAQGDRRWGIVGAALRSDRAALALEPQDGLYSLDVRAEGRRGRRVVGVVLGNLGPAQGHGAVLSALADPETHLVTLTITEAGYGPQAPEVRSAADLLAQALAERRARGLVPFTAISCDNIPANGARLRTLVLAAAQRRDPRLADWISEAGAFPSTMVDRIVPATRQADIDAFTRDTGLLDLGLVRTEPFWQWVIEDRFAGPHPDFESVGVRITPDVAPWEQAKLRLLNGAHSAMAALGGLAGLDFVHEFIAAPERARYLGRLWDEAAATLSPPPGLDLTAYRAALLTRFANHDLPHRLDQIATDARHKVPLRLIAPLTDRAARRLQSPALSLAVAAWTLGLAEGGGTLATRLDAVLFDPEVFPPGLAQNAAARAELEGQLKRLDHDGVRAAMAAVFSPTACG
jgi:fructuronate reductase